MKPKGRGQVVVTKGRRPPQTEHAVVVDGQRLVLSGWKGDPFRDHEQRQAGTDLRGARLLSTHYRLVLYGRFGKVADFLQAHNSAIERKLNATRGTGVSTGSSS